MRLYTIKVGVGEVADIAAAGNYVRIRSVTSGSAVNIKIINDNAYEEAELSQGDDCEFSEFGSLAISHDAATEQTIKIMVSKNRKSGSAQIGGSVAATIVGTITAQPTSTTATTQSTKTVTNASAQIFGGWATRKLMFIQNKDAIGTIWIRFSDAANPAAAANGIRIGPGESFALEGGICHSGTVQAIGDIASNSNIVTLEIGGL